MKKYQHDVFTTPLTERGYLLEESFNRVFQLSNFNYEDRSLMYVASVLYLYGADFNGIIPGFKGKIPKGKEKVITYSRTPSIYFTFHSKPIIHKINQIKIISNEIKKFDYDFWYPYHWLTQDGIKLRSTIKPIMEKDKLTSKMVSWNKKNGKLSEITGFWHTNFVNNNKGKYDFEFKAYRHGGQLWFTILDKKLKKINKNKIVSRQKEYSKLFKDFAEYLYKGFLSNAKEFPKCEYEGK